MQPDRYNAPNETLIYGFFRRDRTNQEFISEFERKVKTARKGYPIEISLTDNQFEGIPGLERKVKSLGFKLLSRSRNPNSGNWINLYQKTPKVRSNARPSVFEV